MRLTRASTFALLLLSACNRASDDPATNISDAANAAAESPANAASADLEVAEAPAQSAPVLDRLGPLRIGATIAELAAEGTRVTQRDTPMEGSTCGYAQFAGLNQLFGMLDGDRLVRIDVRDASHIGPAGIRVGQSEAEALRLLGSGVVVSPHPYTGPQGHYLTLHEDGAPFGLIVETDGKRVESWRIGQWGQVQWIEGCS